MQIFSRQIRLAPWLAYSLAVLAFSACGSTKKDSYQFRVGDCDTGKQEFEADEEEELNKQVCAALQNTEKNKGCAESLRREEFSKKCSGTFTPQ